MTDLINNIEEEKEVKYLNNFTYIMILIILSIGIIYLLSDFLS